MKKVTVILIGLFLMTFAFQSVNAQANFATVSNADAAANVIAPISLAQDNDGLDFGNIIAGTGGTVIMTTDNSRTSTGGVTLQNAVSGQAAIFRVQGLAGAAYSILLPQSNVTLTNTTGGGAETMTIDYTTFNHNITGTPTIIGGNTTFSVGATLTVNNGQAAGAYEGVYEVKVTYE